MGNTKFGTHNIALKRFGTKPILKEVFNGSVVYRGLPVEFQQVAYIESTATQWIDSGIYGNLNTKIEINFINTGNDCRIAGCFVGGSDSNNLSIYLADTGLSHRTRFGAASILGLIAQTNIKTKVAIDKNGVKINGTQYSYDTTPSSFTTPQTLAIFSTRVNDGIAYAKLYSCKIYDNNVLVRDYIPCYRKADGVIGLYDLVNGVFYTNAGTGTFEMGLPVEFQEVEYIESHGEEYIDSGLFGNLNTDVELVAQFTELSTDGKQRRMFGSSVSSNTECVVICISTTETFYGQFDTITLANTDTITQDLNKHYFRISKNGFYVDDTLSRLFTGATSFITPTTMTIFAQKIKPSGGVVNVEHLAKAKLYLCKIYDDTTLVRNFTPCYRKADNVIGLFDKVNKVFYTNAGTGAFTKGANV